MFASIVRGRRGGKTHQLTEIARKNASAILLVHSADEARRMTYDRGVPKEQVFTYSDVLSGHKLRGLQHQGPILIDNLELFLQIVLAQCDDLAHDIIATATGINL